MAQVKAIRTAFERWDGQWLPVYDKIEKAASDVTSIKDGERETIQPHYGG
jgi:hypothetical protein